MITVISYITLRYFFDSDWSGMLLLLPIFLDLAILNKF